jgi:hypothetical protein
MVIKRKFDTDEEAFVKNARYNALNNMSNNGGRAAVTGFGVGAGAGGIGGGIIGKKLSKNHGIRGAIIGAGLGTVGGAIIGSMAGAGIGLLRNRKDYKIAKDKEGKLKGIFRNLSKEEREKIMPAIRKDNNLFERVGYYLDDKGNIDIDDRANNRKAARILLKKESPVDLEKIRKHF